MIENPQSSQFPQKPSVGGQSYGRLSEDSQAYPYLSTDPASDSGRAGDYRQGPDYGQHFAHGVPPVYGVAQPKYVQADGIYPGHNTLMTADTAVSSGNGTAQVPVLGAVKVARMGKRAAARIIDGLVESVVLCVLLDITVRYISGRDVGSVLLATGAMFLGVLVFALAYECLMSGLKGATFGKMAIGLRVITVKGDDPCGVGPAFLRYLVLGACSLVPLVGLVCYLSPFFDKSGLSQGWHDKVAGTLVIDVKG